MDINNNYSKKYAEDIYAAERILDQKYKKVIFLFDHQTK